MSRFCRWLDVFGLVFWSLCMCLLLGFISYGAFRYFEKKQLDKCLISCDLSYPSSPAGRELCQMRCPRPKK